MASITDKDTRVATASATASIAFDHERSYPNSDFATLTDILLRYQQDAGVALHGARCGISMPGATRGESLSVARARWTVSRAGLAALFGSQPAIINEVAAKAWALVDGRNRLLSISGAVDPVFREAGRWSVVSIDAGVGTATIAVDTDGRVSVAECEAGHIGFSPSCEIERVLLVVLSDGAQRVSWEHILTLGVDDPRWDRLRTSLTHDDRADLLARCAGAFVGDVVLSQGSWDGAIVTGSRTTSLKKPQYAKLFSDQFEAKHLRRVLKNTPRWLLERADAPLAGVATMMRHIAPIVPKTLTRPASTTWSYQGVGAPH